MYHDMGLIGGILGALYGCGPVTLLSPKRFQEQPLAWLQPISKYRATHAGGPNFAYDWCVAGRRPKCGAARSELLAGRLLRRRTIRWETLDRFSEAFAPSGFRANAFHLAMDWPNPR